MLRDSQNPEERKTIDRMAEFAIRNGPFVCSGTAYCGARAACPAIPTHAIVRHGTAHLPRRYHTPRRVPHTSYIPARPAVAVAIAMALPRATGPDFEEMMRQKQRDNPQFMFLHPSGAHNRAYRCNNATNAAPPVGRARRDRAPRSAARARMTWARRIVRDRRAFTGRVARRSGRRGAPGCRRSPCRARPCASPRARSG